MQYVISGTIIRVYDEPMPDVFEDFKEEYDFYIIAEIALNRPQGSHRIETSFTVTLRTESQKDVVYDELKQVIDELGAGRIDWHECYHGTGENIPCVPQDVYIVGDA